VNGSFRWRALDDRAARAGALRWRPARRGTRGLAERATTARPCRRALEAFAFGNEHGKPPVGRPALGGRDAALVRGSRCRSDGRHEGEPVAQWVTSFETRPCPRTSPATTCSRASSRRKYRPHAAAQLDLSPACPCSSTPSPSSRRAPTPLQGAARQPHLRLPRVRRRRLRPRDRGRTRWTRAGGRHGDRCRSPTPTFNFKSLRLNTVLRWEWRPGSAIYAVWTQAETPSTP